MVDNGANSGLRYASLALLVILSFYTLLKAPYLAVPFTGDHSLKYNTYVEPALYMAERGDPLWYQQKYTADPVFNPEGRKEQFGHLPLFEWGLFVAYETLPTKSLELKTRIFTHVVGIGILLLAYAFYSRWVPGTMALLSTFLLSINPLFVFSTFVTVLDAPAILFMFLSLLLLTRYFEEKEPKWLFWAGVVFGVGLSVKYSMFLWMAPISLMIIYFRAPDAGEFLYTSSILFFLGLIEIIAMKTSVSILPASPVKGFLLLAVWLSAHGAFWYGMIRMNPRVRDAFQKLVSNRMILYPSILAVLAAGLLLFRYSDLYRFSKNFLIDMSLLMNLKLYKHMLWVQFRSYMTEIIFWLSLAGLLLALVRDDKPVKWLALSFCLGSGVYWIIASKPMFLHSYYTMILMITASFLASIAIDCIIRSARSNGERIIVGFLLAVLIVPGSYRSATARISKHEDVSSAIEFVRKNTSDGDWIVHEGLMTPLVLYTGRKFVYPFRLDNERIKGEIKRIGFSDTMKKYRIRYFMTSKENPTFLDFAPLFAETRIKTPGFDRNYFIENRLGTLRKESLEGFSELERVAIEYRIREKFRLEANMGNLRFYSFHE